MPRNNRVAGRRDLTSHSNCISHEALLRRCCSSLTEEEQFIESSGPDGRRTARGNRPVRADKRTDRWAGETREQVRWCFLLLSPRATTACFERHGLLFWRTRSEGFFYSGRFFYSRGCFPQISKHHVIVLQWCKRPIVVLKNICSTTA